MKSDKPNHGSGKTHAMRIKKPGESWIDVRDRERGVKKVKKDPKQDSN